VESVNEFKDRMKDTLEEAKAALAKSKDDMTLYYNRKWSPAPEFKTGDIVRGCSFIILLFQLQFLVYRHASHLSRALSFSFRIPC